MAYGLVPDKRELARIRALEGGRDVLSWVCVREIQPNVWCVLTRTIPVARRLRVGRAKGRCLDALAQMRVFWYVKPGTVRHFRAPSVHGSRRASYGQNHI